MQENMSQNVDIGPSFYFINCRNLCYKKDKRKVTRFLESNKN